jgi:hypothetical protein
MTPFGLYLYIVAAGLGVLTVGVVFLWLLGLVKRPQR